MPITLTSIKKQSGTLYEIPILFLGYAVICVIFLRPELHKHSFLLVITLIAGVGVVSFLSSMSEYSFRILKISAGTWCFIIATLFTWPLIMRLSSESTGSDHVVAATFLLLAQALLSYVIDRMFIAYRARQNENEDLENNDTPDNNNDE